MSKPTTQPARAREVVTIACKIGVAWFDLEICKEQIVSENTQTGPRDIKQWARTGQVIRVRGTAYPRGEPPEGFPARPEMVAGCALTHNVDKSLWDAWVKQHAKAPYVESGMIFAYTAASDVKERAAELKNEVSGLEPVQRTKSEIKDVRLPRATNKGVSDVEPANRDAAA